MAVVGLRAGTGVPAARNLAAEPTKSAIPAASSAAPSGTTSAPGRKGNGPGGAEHITDNPAANAA